MRKLSVVLVVSIVLALGTGVAFAFEQLTMGTGGTAGNYYAMGGGLAKIYTDNDIPTIAQVTEASVANMRLMSRNRVNIAWTQNDISFYHFNRLFMFEKDPKGNNYSAMLSLFPEYIHLVVMKNSGIKTVEDLKGKKVGVGSPGSSGVVAAQQILSAFGMTFDDIKPEYLSYGESMSQFQDRLLDAVMIVGPKPHPAILSVASLIDLDFIRFTPEDVEKVQKIAPFFVPLQIDAGTYSKQDEAIDTLSVTAMLIVADTLSEDQVYTMTKLLVDNLDTLKTMHATWNQVSLDGLTSGIQVPFHPGAKKCLAELGLKVE
jgi:TRAP transporter TAXI family solute receptor